MQALRYFGQVSKDGRISLPKEAKDFSGRHFEVILLPLEEDIYSYAKSLAEKKEYNFDEKDVEQIIHNSRGLKE